MLSDHCLRLVMPPAADCNHPFECTPCNMCPHKCAFDNIMLAVPASEDGHGSTQLLSREVTAADEKGEGVQG